MTNNSKSTRYYSSRQEKKVASTLGGRVQSNSGATEFQKGDVKLEGVLIECKTSTRKQKQFTIKKEWLTKLKQEQISMRSLLSALVFDFGDGDNYVIVDIATFKGMLESFKESWD